LENLRKQDREVPFLRVDANVRRPLPEWRELWQYRETLFLLVQRDLKLRYRQTILGATWAIIQPFTTMVIFTIFFGGVAKVSTDTIPYPIFSFAALVPWTFFSNGISMASDSLVGQAHLVRKVYFPRIYIPLGRILGGFVDFLIAMVILVFLMLYYGYAPTLIGFIYVIGLFLLMLILTLSVSLWFSALNVRYRDVRYLVPFLLQIWLFATPIAYSASLLSESARTLYALNPMVSVVEGFRWALLRQGTAPQGEILISAAVAILSLLTGILFFYRAESTFSDIV
jgi:lipopolysaccharide transport system permease protein